MYFKLNVCECGCRERGRESFKIPEPSDSVHKITFSMMSQTFGAHMHSNFH